MPAENKKPDMLFKEDLERSIPPNLVGKLSFIGHVDREFLPSVMSAGDIYLFGSKMENFGLAIAEVGLSGRPIIALSSTAISEFVSEDRVMVIEDGADEILSLNFARRVIEYYLNKEDKEFSSKRTDTFKKYLLKSFDPYDIMSRFIDFYGDLLAKKSVSDSCFTVSLGGISDNPSEEKTGEQSNESGRGKVLVKTQVLSIQQSSPPEQVNEHKKTKESEQISVFPSLATQFSSNPDRQAERPDISILEDGSTQPLISHRPLLQERGSSADRLLSSANNLGSPLTSPSSQSLFAEGVQQRKVANNAELAPDAKETPRCPSISLPCCSIL